MIINRIVTVAISILCASVAISFARSTERPDAMKAGTPDITLGTLGHPTIKEEPLANTADRPPGSVLVEGLAIPLVFWHDINKSFIFSSIQEVLMSDRSPAARFKRTSITSFGIGQPNESPLSTSEASLLTKALRLQATNDEDCTLAADGIFARLDIDVSAELIASVFSDALGKSFRIIEDPDAYQFLDEFSRWAVEQRVQRGGE